MEHARETKIAQFIMVFMIEVELNKHPQFQDDKQSEHVVCFLCVLSAKSAGERHVTGEKRRKTYFR